MVETESAAERLRTAWEEHVAHEFATRDTEATLATMVEDAYVNHIPVMTGGTGKEALREFYSTRFIPQSACGVIRCLSEERIKVTDFRTVVPNLEDVFLKLTGHSIRD